MTHSEKLKEIRARSPFPWRDAIHPSGLIKMFDANGAEVALFDIIALSIISTITLASQPAKEAA